MHSFKPLSVSRHCNKIFSELIVKKTTCRICKARKKTTKMKLLCMLLACFFTAALSLSCIPCSESDCGSKPACKAGYIKDVCGCCDICAKTEGERCNGYWNFFGDCAKGLTCVVRKTHEVIPDEFTLKPGRCEPASCSKVRCGLHKRCTMIDNKPTCECPRYCKNKDKPVCGLINGVEYANECEVRKYECKIELRIGTTQGPCKRCFYNGELYKFGEKMFNKNKCQDCVCAHGEWNCRHNNACVLVTVPPTTESCPMFKCSPCKYGYVLNDKGCQTCQCKEKKSVCEQPMNEGPCFSQLRRFYYNKKYNKCVEFTFGGCLPNGNNFKSKKSCEAKCLNYGSH